MQRISTLAVGRLPFVDKEDDSDSFSDEQRKRQESSVGNASVRSPRRKKAPPSDNSNDRRGGRSPRARSPGERRKHPSTSPRSPIVLAPTETKVSTCDAQSPTSEGSHRGKRPARNTVLFSDREEHEEQRIMHASSLEVIAPDRGEVKNELRACAYYHGFLPRSDAQDLLHKKHEFLLRKSERPGVGITVILSLRLEEKRDGEELPPAGVEIPRQRRVVDHINVPRDNRTKKWAVRENEWFKSIDDMLLTYAKKGIPLIDGDRRYIIRYPIPRMNYLLRHSQVIRYKKIGAGAFGEVFKGKLKIDEERSWNVAIKCLPEGMIVSKEQRDNFVAEARTCRKLNHSNIIRLRGIAIDEMPLMMVLEWAENGSMLDVLRKRCGEITLVDKELMLTYAASGMRYLEKKNVIHRDVAARNCLLDENMIVKISDFGLSMATAFYKGAPGKRPIRWLAPESIAHYEYTTKTDVFAFGVLMWEVFTNGKQPFSDLTNQAVANAVVKSGLRLQPPPEMAFSTAQLMKACFNTLPHQRPSFHTLKEKLRREYESMAKEAEQLAQRRRGIIGWLTRKPG